MNERGIPVSGASLRNQETSITLNDGRTFAVCSKGQYRFILEQARHRIVGDMMDKKELTEDTEANDVLIEERLARWAETKCPFAPLSWILSKMSPEDRKDWEQKYRFGAIVKKT